MRRVVVLLGLLAVLATGCGRGDAAPDDVVADAVDGCPDVQVVGLRGQAQSLEHHRGLGTEVDAVATALERRLADRGVEHVEVDAVEHRSRDASALGAYADDVADGRARLADDLREVAEDCPEARVVVLGFSQGAQIAQETLASDPGLAAGVDLLGLVGSPRHDPDAPFVRVDLPGPEPGREGVLGAGPDLGPLASRTVSACLTGDVVCDADGGSDYAVHKHGYEPDPVSAAIATALDRALA